MDRDDVIICLIKVNYIVTFGIYCMYSLVSLDKEVIF